jgi:hypothetical protein
MVAYESHYTSTLCCLIFTVQPYDHSIKRSIYSYILVYTILLGYTGICVAQFFIFFKLLSGVEALSPPP